MAGNHDQRGIFTGADALTDNVALSQWFNETRRVLHASALELGVTASELDARLRAVSGGVVIGGLTARARARQVAKPITHASDALVVASQYIVTASTRFEAVYLPELEAVGHRPRKSDFRFTNGGGGGR
ncbi:hypothetical protein [Micromonospora inyonensis]|uniref:Uncharacterized protein n=1 Tax=Micromonospora inyonensis TaxID=47866 RepID=A0A1C6R765_9ACTN|nr:hypothetical protein [Micromonospora inyonensis]SCL12864.1 hypothetical protein GA0074694_0041 [Micromonospora inyonensis]